MRLSPLGIVKTWCVVFLITVIGVSKAFSQATPTNNASFPRHETANQRVILVDFSTNLAGSTTTNQWKVYINGVQVTTTGVSTTETGTFGASASPTADLVAIQFDASALPSHVVGGYQSVLPSETTLLTVQYDATQGTPNSLKTSGTLANVASFGPIQSKNNYVPACGTDLLYASEGVASLLDQCAPVNTDFYRWTYQYSLRYRNSSTWNAPNNKLHIVWGSGGSTTDLAGYPSDNGGNFNTNFITVGTFTGGNPGVYLTFRTGANPATGALNGTNAFSYPDNPPDMCNFRNTFTPQGVTTAVYDCAASPTLTRNTQFNSYDFDDQNTGSLVVDNVVPTASLTTTTDRVCLGQNVGARFIDNSVFNCIGNGTVIPTPTQGAATTPINNQQRWVRFIYGGNDSPTPQGNIPDIRVNGVQVTHSTTGAVLPAFNPNPLLVGGPTTRGYVPTGAGGAGIPDANGVIELLPNSTVSGTLSALITTSAFTNQVVGQRFYVTIQYWNVCNPYTGGAQPVQQTLTDYIEIVTKPVPLTTTGLSVCYDNANGIGQNFSVASSIGGTRSAVNWYALRSQVGTATKMNNPNGTNSLDFPAASYTAQGGSGTYATNNANGRYYSVWATQVAGTVNGCESDPIEVVIVQQPRIDIAPDIPLAPNGSTNVCNGGAAVNYSSTPPGSKTIAATTSTNAAAINLPLENFWSQSFGAGVSLSSTTGGSINVTYALAAEPNPSQGGQIRVQRRYVNTTAINVVSPLVAPAVVPTYTINPQQCANANQNTNVTIWGISDGGQISAAGPICVGSSTGNMTVTTHRGAILRWERSADNGATWVSIGGAGLATITNTPPAAGTYKYKVIVQNQNASGPCAVNETIPAKQNTVVVNPIPTKPTITPSGVTTFCLGGSVTLTAASTNAATYKWYRNGVATGATTAAIVLNSIAQNGTYTVEGIGVATSNCVSPLSDPVVLTVNALPAGDVSGGGSICNPPPTASPPIVFNFSAGATPWDVTYTITGVAQPTLNNIVSGANITSPGAGVYRITSIIDNNGCAAPAASMTFSGAANATVTVGGSPPAFDTAPALASAQTCSNGASTTDPSLSFNLNAASTITAQNYTLTYTADGVAKPTKTFQVDATGAIVQVNGAAATAITFNDTEFNSVAAHTLRLVSILSPAGCLATLNTDLPYTVNPLPAAASPTVATACTAYAINIDPQTTAVNVAPGNSIPSTFAWTGAYGALTGMGAAGTGNISGTLTNPTNATINAVFTVTPTAIATGCAGPNFTITVPVKARPLIPAQAVTICSGATFNGTPVNNLPSTIVPAGTQYTWTVAANPAVTGQFNQAAPQASISQTLTNLGNLPQTLNYTVQATQLAAPACAALATFNLAVTVNPKPTVPAFTVSTCSGTAFNATPVHVTFPTVGTIIPAGTTYTWAAPVVTGGITGGAAGAALTTISQTLTNPSTTTQTATYTITPTSPTGPCAGTAFVLTVNVHPIPALTSSLTPPSICSGTFSYTPTSATPGTTFTWTRAGVAGLVQGASSGSGNISETLTNSITTPINVVYAITSTANTCPRTQNVTVIVNPTPLANAVLGPSNVCVGPNPFFYSVTQRAGSTYSWNIPAGISVEAAGGGAVSGGGAGPFSADYFILLKFTTPNEPAGQDITVTEKTAAGCTRVNTLHIVAANSPPTVPISGGNNFCKFQTGVVFSVPQNASSTFTWTVDPGATIIGPSAGTNLYQIIVDFGSIPVNINVTETNSTGCPANYPTLTVALSDAPVIAPAPGNICSGTQPSSSVSLPAITSIPSTYSWFVKSITASVTGAFVNDVGSGPLEHFPPLRNISGSNGTIVYTVTPTSTSAPFCIGVPVDITVTVKPEPVVAALADQSFCPNVFVNGATSFPLTSNVAGATMNWSSSNPAIGLAAATGSGNIAFTAAENLTGADIVSVINVTATAASCTSAGANAKTFNLTIKPRPVVAAITDIVVCPGDAVSVPAFTSNTSGGETYAWTNDNTSIGLAGSGTGNIAGYFAPANNTGVDLVGNLTITATRLSCAGPARTFKITVRPQPVITTVTNKFFCPGDAINIPLTSNVAGATINWTNSNTSVGLAASGTGDISGTAAVNNTGADIVGTFSVSGTANGCVSTGVNIKTFTVTIRPTPIVDAVTNITVCSGANIPLIAFGSNITSGGVTFNWTNNNPAVNLAASGSGNIAAFTAATNLTGVPIVATVDVTGVKNGCSGPIRQFTITVNPEPVVAAVATQEFCPTDLANIVLASNVAGATINWTNTNPSIGLAASGTGNISFTAPANNTGANIVATITVTATANTCTSAGVNAKSFQIRIKPTPIMTAITDVAVCSGGAISTIVFAANTGGAETFSWTNDNTAVGIAASGTGNIVGYTAPINISGTPIVANISVSATRQGCVGPAIVFKVTINPEPVVSVIADQFFCPTDAINIPFVSNVAGSTINWTNDNPAIGLGATGSGNIASVAPVNNTGVDIVANIVVTATRNGCTSTGANSKTFKITVRPTPVTTAVANITVCSGATINVPAFTSNIGSGGVTFNWTNDNTAIGLGAAGVGSITSFAAASNVTSSSIIANLSVTGTKNGCVGPARTFTITILPQPVGTPTNIAICSDAAVGVNLSTLISGGASAASYNITIGNAGGLIASAGSPANGNGLLANEILNDKWTNITGSAHDIVYHIIPVAGGSPACTGASFDLRVTINPEPVVAVVANQVFCPGDPVNIALTSNVSGANISWSNSNPAVGIAFTGTGDITYTAPANATGANITATITVTAESNTCISAGANLKTFTITIKPSPIVTAVSDITVCSGGSISAINFTANTGGGETFNWTNDNTAVGLAGSGTGNIAAYTAPINVSGVPIVANFSVTATRNSCVGPAKTFKITVNPEPVVAPLTNLTFCSSDPIIVAFASNVAGATISWTNTNTSIGVGASGFGNLSFATPVNTSGSDIVGTINVIATANTCVSTGANAKSFTITIKPSPVVNAVTSIAVCSGATVPLIAFGSNVVSGGVTFNWTNDNTGVGLAALGTGNIASFVAAVNTTSTPFVANISVTGTKNGCTSITPRTFTITVMPQPVGTPVPFAVCSDAAVGVNLSTYITSGASASTYNIQILNPDALVASAGAPADGTGLLATEIQNDKWTNLTGTAKIITYRITPVSGGSPGCAGSPFDLPVTINPEPVVDPVAIQIFCPGDAINIPLTSNVAGANISWTNSNPAVGLAFSGTGSIAATAPANNTGANINATITVMAEANTCTSAGANIKTFTLRIKPSPNVNTVSDVTVCSGGAISAINFTANTGGGESFSWTNDNTAVGLAASGIGNIIGYTAPINVSGSPIVANITVTASLASCIGAPRTFKITINPEPVVTALPNITFCSGDPINVAFASNVVGATISWTNSNTAIGIGASGLGDMSFAAPTNNSGSDIVGTINVIATANTCVSAGANAKSFTITIKPSPVVNAVTSVTVCSGATVPLITFGSNVVGGGVVFNWTNDNTGIGLPASGVGNIASFTAAINTTSTPFVANISVIGTKNSCSSITPRTFTITILPQPVGTPTPVTVCSDVAVGVNLSTFITGGAAASTYNITILNPDGLTASAGTPADGTGLLATEIQNDKWTNHTGLSRDIIYRITPVSGGSPGCAGDPFDLIVTIDPEPVVTAVTNKIFCPGEAINIPLTSNVGGATISWSNSNPGIGLAFTGTGSIVATAPANNTGANIVGTITVSAEAAGCISAGANVKTFDITIKPTPVVNTVTDVTVCSGAPIATISFSANTAGGETFNWTNDNGAIGLAASGSGPIVAYTAPVNITGVPIVANISVTATRLGCSSLPMVFKITINPEPVVAAIADQPFCAGDPINIAFTSNVPGAAISWTNDNTLVGIGVTGAGDLSFAAGVNNTGSDIVGNFVVSASRNGCVSTGANRKTFKITIKPTPIVNAMTDITVCSGGNVVVPAFGSNVVAAGVTFSWSNDNTVIGLAASGSGDIATFTAGTNTTGAPITGTITYFGTRLSCVGPSKSFRIIVLPQPVGIPTSIAVCSDAAVNVNLASLISGSAASYNIAILNPSGLVASAGSPGNNNGVSATEIQDDRWTNVSGGLATITYRITPIGAGSPGCVGAQFDLTVDIKPEPVVTPVPLQEFCPATAVTVPLASNVGGATISWTNNNPLIGLGFTGSGNISYTTPANNSGSNVTGTITVSASNAGCVSSGSNIKTFDITIKPTPIINTVSNVVVCSGGTISTINFTSNTGGSETYAWTNSNTAIGIGASGTVNIPGYTAPINISGAPIVATIGVTATRNGCVGPVMNFTITVSPEPVVAAVGSPSFCAGEPVSIALTSNVPGAVINWTNSNSSIGLGASGSGNISFTAAVNNTGSDIVGNIVVTAIKDGCTSAGANAKTFQITIKPTPVVTAIVDIPVCSGQTVNVPAFASNVVSGGVTFDWTNDNVAILLGASGTGNIPSFTAATNISGVPMIANIQVIGTKNSCASLPVSFRIIVNPEPVVAAVIDKQFCPGDIVNIPLTSNVAGAAISWTNSNAAIGIPSSGTNDIAFTAPVNASGVDFVGSIVVTAERNGCFSTGANQKTFLITIKATPVVSPVTSLTVCSGEGIGAIAFTSNADPGVTFNWTNDNPAIGLAASGTNTIAAFTAAVNTGAVPLIANLSVRGTKNGCQGAAVTFTIQINPEPVLSVPAPAPICSRDLTNITLGTNGSSVNASSYRIDQIEYSSNGGPFGVAVPAGFTLGAGNKTVGSSGTTVHIKTDFFTNLSPFFVEVRYTVTPIGPSSVAIPAGCPGDAQQITVKVNPEPDLDDALNPADICSGESVVAANPGYLLRAESTSVAATEFIIRSISAPGLVAGPGNEGTGDHKPADAINDDVWINTGSTFVTVTYLIAPVAGTCIGPDEEVKVRVNPSPAMKDGLDRITCSDANSGIVLVDNRPSSVQAASFDIVSVQVGGVNIPKGTFVGGLTADPGNADPGVTVDPDEIRFDKFENLTNDRIVVTYRVAPIAGPANNNCRGPEKVITLVVEPKVVSISVNATPTICSGDAVDITFASPTYANGNPANPTVTFSYSATAGSVSGATVQNNLVEGSKITDVLVNNTTSFIDVTYHIIPRASAAANGIGCNGDVEDVVVRVEPKPKITAIPNKTICEGTSVALNLSSTTVPSTGSIKIFVTATADPGVTGFTNGVLVPNGTVLSDVPVLDRTTIHSIRFVTYHLEVRNVDALDATICSAGPPIDVVVGISPKPMITAIPNFAICSGDSFDPIPILTDTETEIPGSTLITWTATPNANVSGESNGAGNAFSQVLFNTTNNKQDVFYNISATNINNTPSCLATPATPLKVTVYPNPKVVGLPSSANVCNNGTLTPNPFVLNASTVAALGTTFDWTVDNGGNPDLPVIAPATNQTQITQTFVNNGSFLGTQQYTIKAHLTMSPGDNPLIDTSITDAVCEAQTDAVIVVNVAPPVSGDIYGFDIDGNQATEIYLCRGAKQFVYIDPVGLPLMDVTYKENGVTKTLTKLGGLNVLQVSPANTTTYELLTIKDKFGCVQTINKTVTVHVDEVDNAFSVVGPNIACSPFPVTFQHNQVAGTSYTWKWLDGPDSTTYQAGASVAGKHIKHIYTNPSPGSTAKFRASLDAFLDTTKYLAGCRKKPVVVEVRVHPTVSTAVFPDKDVICSDETVAFVNSSQGVNATGHRWFYRVSGSSTELDVKTTPNVTFKIPNTTTSNPLIYEVVYRATNGNCPAPEVITPITVYRGVDAHFSNTEPTVFIGGHSTATFTNDSAPVDGADFRYEWDFGLDANPATAQGIGPFNLDYITPGPKEVKLVATNFLAEAAGLTCADQFVKIINIVVPPLIADFTAIPLEACFPTDITVTENKATGDKFAWRVLDNAGTAAQSNAELPVFKVPAPGKYTIELVTTNSFTGDQKTATKDVIIYNLPMASFDMRPGVVYVPDTEVLTYNFSDGATSYLWDFGDGSTSDDKEPTYQYRIEGVYDVTLIAMNDHGNGVVCADTLSRKITAKQGGVTRVPNAFTPNPNGPTTSAGTPGVPGSNTFNDVFLPQVKGAEEFNMQIFDRWGNLIFESNNSNVGWDGYDRHGRLMPSGVYVYKLTLRLSDGQRTTQVGDITMIR